MDVAELSDQLFRLREEVSSTTSIRHEEKATNEETIKDVQDAQSNLTQAIQILKDFYVKNFSASTTWTQVYNGNQVGSTNIFDSLQVISDGSSARLESVTTAAESEAVGRKSSGTDCDDVYCLDFRVQHSGEAVTTANSYGTDQ